jgi:hypothetical protein
MTKEPHDMPPVEEPLADLEKRLIHDYLAGLGQDYRALQARDDDEARRWLSEAARYASGKLTEVETRAHYVQHLHDGS